EEHTAAMALHLHKKVIVVYTDCYIYVMNVVMLHAAALTATTTTAIRGVEFVEAEMAWHCNFFAGEKYLPPLARLQKEFAAQSDLGRKRKVGLANRILFLKENLEDVSSLKQHVSVNGALPEPALCVGGNAASLILKLLNGIFALLILLRGFKHFKCLIHNAEKLVRLAFGNIFD
ncbi:hypothetical protein ACJX0J_039854, partial [Zea mays]